MSSKNKIVLKGNLSKVESYAEALECVKKAEMTIEKFQPQKPKWLNSYNSKAPMLNSETNIPAPLFALVSLATGSIIGLVLGGCVSFIFNNPSPLVWILSLGIPSLIATSIFGSITFGYKYGGSKTRQPVRKFFAKLGLNKKELETLELRVEEYEAYSKAQEIHQALIANTKNNLIDRGVFDMLNTKNEQHSLDENGVHKIVEGELYLTESYSELSDNMVKYLSESFEIEK